ncbi:MAG: YraN family protein [Rubrivivax sp.]
MVRTLTGRASPLQTGQQAEELALRHLVGAGMRLLQRNYRVARGPGARAGEIDLILREPDGTVVFVEVRSRAGGRAAALRYGGAAASVDPAKQSRIVYAARHWLMRQPSLPPCRFDVVAIDGGGLTWLKAAFDAA